MARPSHVGIGAISGNTGGNLSPAIPTHQADDVGFARITYYGPNTAGDALDIPTPANWTMIGSQGGGSDARHGIFFRRFTGAGTTVTFTRGVSWDTGTDTEYCGRVSVWRNLRTSGNPYDSSNTQGTETQANAVWLAMTAFAQRTHLMMMGVTDDIAAPTLSGYTVDWATVTDGSDGAVGILYKDVDSGTEGGGNLTSGAPAQGNYRLDQLILRPQTVSGAAVVTALTLDRVTSGAYTRRGVVALQLTLDRFFHAWQQHYGAVSLPMTLGIVTTGQSVIFGRATGLQIAVERQVSGNYTRRGVASLDLSFNSQVIGRGSFYAVAAGLDMVVGIVTVGALPLALGVLTENGLDLTPFEEGTAEALLPILSEVALDGNPLTTDIQTLTALI